MSHKQRMAEEHNRLQRQYDDWYDDISEDILYEIREYINNETSLIDIELQKTLPVFEEAKLRHKRQVLYNALQDIKEII